MLDIIRDEMLTVQVEQMFEDYIKYQEEQRVDEAFLDLVGLGLSLPFVVKMIGQAVDWLTKKIVAIRGKGFTGDQLGKKIIEIGEKYHHKMISGFAKVLSVFFKDPKKANKAANVVFYGIIGGLLVHTGFGLLDKLSHADMSGGLVKGVKAIIKAAEIRAGVVPTLHDISKIVFKSLNQLKGI